MSTLLPGFLRELAERVENRTYNPESAYGYITTAVHTFNQDYIHELGIATFLSTCLGLAQNMREGRQPLGPLSYLMKARIILNDLANYLEKYEERNMSNLENQVTSPLLMGETIIGGITVDLNTGEFHGQLDSQAAAILKDGFQEGVVRSVTIQSFYGLAAKQDMTVQERWRAYLQDDRSVSEPEYWSLYDNVTNRLEARNLPSEKAAKKRAQDRHRDTGHTYHWYKQAGRMDGPF